MIDVKELKPGNFVRLLKDNYNMGLKAGDILRVVKTGHSRWDGWDYADCKADNGCTIEIMKNFRDFERVV